VIRFAERKEQTMRRHFALLVSIVALIVAVLH